MHGQVLLQEVPIHKAAGTHRAGENRNAQVGQRVPHEAAKVEVALVTDATGLPLQVQMIKNVTSDHMKIFGQCFPTGGTFQLWGGCP